MSFCLETPRLLLRELTLDDTDALLQMFSDPEHMHFYGQTKDRPKTIQWIERVIPSYAAKGFGLWAACDRESGWLLGYCGISIQWVENLPREEIGYHIRRDLCGRGLATEAAARVRDHAFENLQLPSVISWMPPDHRASRRVAEKIGMREVGKALNPLGRLSVVYEITAQQWEIMRSRGYNRRGGHGTGN